MRIKILPLVIFLGVLSSNPFAEPKGSVPDWLGGMGVSVEEAPITLQVNKAPEKPVFKDVQQDHWASESVNDLVSMGVTQGYPDGTFRGSKRISRYETAMFLSKLAHSRETRDAVNEKLMEELRAEVYKLRYTLDMYKRKPEAKRPVYGSFAARIRIGNIVSANSATPTVNAPIGPVFDYRLTTNYRHDFSDYSFLRICFDTIDSSINGTRKLSDMLEMEGEVNTKSGFGVSVTSGPGLVIHREGPSNIIPSEDQTAYLKQNNGIKVFYAPGDMDYGIGYKATSITTAGASTMNDISTYIQNKFRGTYLGDITAKYSFDMFYDNLRSGSSTTESIVNTYDLIFEPTGKTEYSIKLGVRASQNTPHNMFAKLDLTTKDLFREGSVLRFSAAKVGNEFFDPPTYPAIYGLSLTDKLYQNGTTNIALEVSQAISKVMTTRVVANLVTGTTGLYDKGDPLSNGTFEMGLDIGVFENAVTTILYRIYQNPGAATNATSDLFGLGFKYSY